LKLDPVASGDAAATRRRLVEGVGGITIDQSASCRG
jgi:hypothetical protein